MMYGKDFSREFSIRMKKNKNDFCAMCKDCVYFDGTKMCSKYTMITEFWQKCKSFWSKDETTE
jgi:hypothetical protein